MSEVYKFSHTVTREDGREEEISVTLYPNSPDGYVTHTTLAKRFNAFLDACGFVGHNYTNTPEFDRES